MNNLIKYLQDTRAELTHVKWPTQQQTIMFTIAVILVSVGVALYVSFFDFLFSKGLSLLIK